MSSAPPDLPAACRLFVYDRLGSTNDEAKRMARSGAAAWSIVTAREQTAGRGRRGRSWIGIPGNLFMSVILRPDRPAQVAAQLGFVAALAVGHAVRGVLPSRARTGYKWPNDVLLAGGKVAGILLESETAVSGELDWLVIGIGVNIAGHPAIPGYRTTSLVEEGAVEVDATTMLHRIAVALDRGVEAWLRGGFAPVRAAWLREAVGIGEAITVRLGDGPVSGHLAGLAEDGALLVETEDGARRITAGDVLLTPA
jgi:BirA family biotin operon repressor/biotin-[acetyl-CoA-carboxylase] ligase